ncbi:MAG: septum formation initiator family protein [Prevotella sp.]
MKKVTWVSELLRRSRFLKYVLVFVVGVALVGFVGDSSVLSHISNKKKIAELQEEIKFHQDQYERDFNKLRRLETDPRAIVEIARERYFMKKDDEDIFVLSEDAPSTTTNKDETTE